MDIPQFKPKIQSNRSWVFLRKNIHVLYSRFVAPKSQNEDAARREYILNIILLSVIGLLLVLDVQVLLRSITLGEEYKGVAFGMFSMFMFLFLGLYALSRKGYVVTSSYILILLYCTSITYSAFRWGVELPSVLLGYALVITMAGVLLGRWAAVLLTGAVAAVYYGIGYAQAYMHILPDKYWKLEIVKLDDIVEYMVTLGVIMVVSWLSAREIDRSLARARKSESILKQERDMLEVVVEERTRELRQTQLEHITELYRFAEFGRLASGMFHDLVNPLSAIALNLGQLQEPKQELEATQGYVRQTITAARRMEDFIGTIRRHMVYTETKTLFSLNDEIAEVIKLFDYKARTKKVALRFQAGSTVRSFGNQFKFHHIVANLVSNAIDAYGAEDSSNPRPREVVIKLEHNNDRIRLEVTDFGSGMTPEVAAKVFEPFFTTKPEGLGTGIGLATTKYMVEKDFGGIVQVTSRPGGGSTFIVAFNAAQDVPA